MSESAPKHIRKTPFNRFILNVQSALQYSAEKHRFDERYADSISAKIPAYEARFIQINNFLLFSSLIEIFILNDIALPLAELLNIKLPFSPGIKEILLFFSSNLFLGYTLAAINYFGHLSIISIFCATNFLPIEAEIYGLKFVSSNIVSCVAKVHAFGYISGRANKIYAGLFIAFIFALMLSIPLFALYVQISVVWNIYEGNASWGTGSYVIGTYSLLTITLSWIILIATFLVPFRYVTPEQH